MAKHSKQRELHQTINWLQTQLDAYKVALNAMMTHALELEEGEAERLALKMPPPIELLDDVPRDELEVRLRRWVREVIHVKVRDRNRLLLERGCPNCGYRYDGVVE